MPFPVSSSSTRMPANPSIAARPFQFSADVVKPFFHGTPAEVIGQASEERDRGPRDRCRDGGQKLAQLA